VREGQLRHSQYIVNSRTLVRDLRREQLPQRICPQSKVIGRDGFSEVEGVEPEWRVAEQATQSCIF
jgi:hypothetical protein